MSRTKDFVWRRLGGTSCSLSRAIRGAYAIGLVRLAGLTRRCHPRGTGHLLVCLHNPYRRNKWSIETVVVTADGIRCCANTASFLEWRILFYGVHERAVQRFIRWHARPGSDVVDVGANFGFHTLLMAQIVGGGQVIACEANPMIYQRLLQNVELNRISNVVAQPVAVADGPGKAGLYVPRSGDANQGTARLAPPVELPVDLGCLRLDAECLTVETDTLDHICERTEAKDVSLVKIDVEGFEGAVLDGSRAMLQKWRPAVVFEYEQVHWEPAGYVLEDVVRVLCELGYDRWVVSTLDGEWINWKVGEEIGPSAVIGAWSSLCVNLPMAGDVGSVGERSQRL